MKRFKHVYEYFTRDCNNRLEIDLDTVFNLTIERLEDETGYIFTADNIKDAGEEGEEGEEEDEYISADSIFYQANTFLFMIEKGATCSDVHKNAFKKAYDILKDKNHDMENNMLKLLDALDVKGTKKTD
jgi:hypothetical protein